MPAGKLPSPYDSEPPEDGVPPEATAPGRSPLKAKAVVALWSAGSVVVDVSNHARVVIGRGADCDLSIDDTSVSRRHAILYIDDDLAIEDCGSTNGTRVGGAALAPHRRMAIPHDATISIGNAIVVLRGFSIGSEWETTDTGNVVDAPNTPMGRLRKLVDLVAKSDLSALIIGETGVGKEGIAERIHSGSPRKDGPLVKINCAAMPENLLESELFGFEKGAFTGALTSKPGLVESADRGTLFLDEVGDMALSTQAKLLRVLESREVMRLGALRARRVDVRFVSATNRRLDALVKTAAFRSDLYFRLNGISVQVPPLRERLDELPRYVEEFLTEIGARAHMHAQISDDAVRKLLSFAWPGNLRQLRNTVERAAMLSQGCVIQPCHILFDDQLDEADVPSMTSTTERQRIIDALAQSGGNQTGAAALLGISRRTLVYKLDHHDIPRPRKGLRQK